MIFSCSSFLMISGYNWVHKKSDRLDDLIMDHHSGEDIKRASDQKKWGPPAAGPISIIKMY